MFFLFSLFSDSLENKRLNVQPIILMLTNNDREIIIKLVFMRIKTTMAFHTFLSKIQNT